jgi:hypothetical protein
VKVFEYGVLKDGAHRLAYMPGSLVEDSELGPCLVDEVDRDEGPNILGEIHELSAAEARERDWLYSAFKRERRQTTDGERVWIYALVDRAPQGKRLERGLWLYPRRNSQVWRVVTADGKRFEGSYREVLEGLYRDQWTVDGRRRFKREFARRIRVLGGRAIRTETLESFFSDLARSRSIICTRIWPKKPIPTIIR